MRRLFVHVEGQTEETFVTEVLRPHLAQFDYSVSARILGNSRQRDRRGGIVGWHTARKDILNHLKQDVNCKSTTMVDFYALPKFGQGAWPGREVADTQSFVSKAETVHNALRANISSGMGADFMPSRFVPYVMMYEFEGLLFSDCNRFASGIGNSSIAPKFQEIRDAFTSPEEINDSPITAPSKRVMNLVPGYEKPLLGSLAILEIGLDAIRDQCPQFNQWLVALEV